MEKWRREPNYMGENYYDYFVIYSHHRDSGILQESNYQTIKKALKDYSGFIEVQSSHWAVGWVEFIGMHETDKNGLIKAQELEDSLKDYPVLDDDDFSQRESELTSQLADEIEKDKETLSDEVFNRVWDKFSKDMTREQIEDKISYLGLIEY